MTANEQIRVRVPAGVSTPERWIEWDWDNCRWIDAPGNEEKDETNEEINSAGHVDRLHRHT